MEREVFVSLDTAVGPVLIGRLWSRSRRGVETATFQYDGGWLRRPDRRRSGAGQRRVAHDGRRFRVAGGGNDAHGERVRACGQPTCRKQIACDWSAFPQE